MSAKKFEDVVGSVDELMGIKAIFRPLNNRAICFSSRGDPDFQGKDYFRLARVAAEYAASRPYLIMIGGGAEVREELRGRVVYVAQVSKAYGRTSSFCPDPEDQARLAQWPVATGLLDVFEVAGHPHLVEEPWLH